MAVTKPERVVVLVPAGTPKERASARSRARRLMIDAALKKGLIALPIEQSPDRDEPH